MLKRTRTVVADLNSRVSIWRLVSVSYFIRGNVNVLHVTAGPFCRAPLGIETFRRFLLSLSPLPTNGLLKTRCLQVTCVGGIRCVLRQRDAYTNAVPRFGPAAIKSPFPEPRSEWICIDPLEYVWTSLTYGQMQAVIEEDDYLVWRWMGKVGKTSRQVYSK